MTERVKEIKGQTAKIRNKQAKYEKNTKKRKKIVKVKRQRERERELWSKRKRNDDKERH